jgi:pyruvate formate lyase activating enzyme
MVPEELTGGYIFDIQGFSVHDGPGCRTLIFFKGCTLRCNWCSNPEGLHPFPEPLYNAAKCIFDNLCIDACTRNAIIPADNSLEIDRECCRDCKSYDCAVSCCTSALRTGGYFITLADLYGRICRDRHYWGNRGGITLTGGEPFLQPGFSGSLLKRSYNAYIHTAVETCGNVPWESIEPSIPWIDWIFYDLKQMDDEKHRSATGSGNRIILENAVRLSQRFKGTMIFRMPVIPGFNDSDDHILQIAAFINSTGKNVINVLPIHHLGREKYNLTGKFYYTSKLTSPSSESLRQIQSLFEKSNITCYIGSETPF